MARNTLEAVFGAVGAGLTGYGMGERQKREEEERRRREAFDRAINLERLGYQAEDQARLGAQQQTQDLARSGQIAGAAPRGTPFSMVGSALTQASQALPQANLARGRRMTLDGQTFVQPFSESRAGIREAEEMRERGREERSAERRAEELRLASQLRREEEKLSQKERRTTLAAGAPRATAKLSPEERAYQATLAFANRQIADPMNLTEPRYPTPDEVNAFAAQALAAAASVFGGGNPAGAQLTQKPQKPADVSQEEWDQYLRETGQWQ